ncbi:MAG: CoA ester lyase [Alphaproteobacteria bacterium]|nr:CoA ester lyase [Alphaproteobacteria bacterium]
MQQVIRPRRTMLYMPGANARAMEKARNLPADGLILDLEDATAPERKDQARELVCETLQGDPFGHREVLVRVNGLDTEWGRRDLEALAQCSCDGVLVPKIHKAEDVLDVVGILERAGAPAELSVWLMMETPLSMLHAEAIAGSHQRLAGMVMGTNDLAKDLGASQTPLRLPMITALGLCMLAARAHGLAIIDGVFNDIHDAAGLRESCVQGLEMGFDGKTVIHPQQLQVANEVYSPTKEQIDLAHRQIQAYEAAMQQGKAVAVVDNKIVEGLHVVHAKRVLALAQSIQRPSVDAAS